ncbi:DUF2917 domain-containing protein [Ramlibacter sp. USB13]|uniref:DUF2917 domain-containing protein n=1 Tax=Ramlibacter cellulosilyticus TaxID=2764187 RepID=A0A923MSZ4_9BURK|nr:DUF2917 domain-containing protein [Ramlibacter cellulosilyticus]MBC5784673.1 DUF2917 domain-containing protein [Ramlibacter cellulosilyticus]
MFDLSATRLLASAPTSALPGTWKLARGRAITLRPATDGIVRVAHGRVWATVDGPHGVTPDDSGDHVLEVGRSMYVKAGQRVVLEAWNQAGASYFAWDPVLATVRVVRPRLNFSGVLQPLADLRMAAAIGFRALGQLATGLVRLAWQVVRPGRAVPPARGRRAYG